MLDFTKSMDKMLLPTTKQAWADLLILAILLGAINVATKGFADFGWLSVNPSPWLLVPLFLGRATASSGALARGCWWGF